MKTTWIRNGDRFKVENNGHTGQILAESHVMDGREIKEAYIVRWDHTDGEHTYMKHDDLKVIDALNAGLEKLVKEIEELGSYVDSSIKYNVGEIKIACDHVWKMYHGLINSFEYCEKCDEKR